MTSLFQDSGSAPAERADEAIRLLGMLDEKDHLFSEAELRFVVDLRRRVKQYHLKTIVTPKQLFWLRDIKDKWL